MELRSRTIFPVLPLSCLGHPPPHSFSRNHTRTSRFKCASGQTGFFTKLGRLIQEKAKSDVEKTRDNLAVIDELLLYWKLSDTDRFLAELEEALLVADFGPRITIKIVESLRDDTYAGNLKSGSEIKDALKRSIFNLLTAKKLKTELRLGFRKPAVIMVVGINGGGKTASLGNFPNRLKKEGTKVFLAAKIRLERLKLINWRYGQKERVVRLLLLKKKM
ncbi:cell division protein FtsY homolog, chloroplastic-like [Primulina huaijiensis]|uniref:cell division protein FtsY homolog, chloroplastic-like n=1 Tax=Primulina huaijiensis TaxID=1492673 RepID=UPI003CC728F9